MKHAYKFMILSCLTAPLSGCAQMAENAKRNAALRAAKNPPPISKKCEDLRYVNRLANAKLTKKARAINSDIMVNYMQTVTAMVQKTPIQGYVYPDSFYDKVNKSAKKYCHSRKYSKAICTQTDQMTNSFKQRNIPFHHFEKECPNMLNGVVMKF